MLADKDYESLGIEKDDAPKYLYGTCKMHVELDSNRIIDNLEESVSFEDDIDMFTESAREDIREFCKRWNAENRYQYFEEDPSVLIIIEKEREQCAK